MHRRQATCLRVSGGRSERLLLEEVALIGDDEPPRGEQRLHRRTPPLHCRDTGERRDATHKGR